MIMFYIVTLFQKLKVWLNRYLKFLAFHYIGVVAAVEEHKEEPSEENTGFGEIESHKTVSCPIVTVFHLKGNSFFE